MQHSWTKYGESAFSFEIIELCTTDHLFLREQRHVDALDATNPDVGFNNCPVAGTCLGVKRTKEQIEANRKRNLERVWTDEERRRQAQVWKEFNSINFELVSPSGEIVKGRCLKDFASQNGLTPSALTSVLKGRQSHHRGWRRPENKDKPFKLISRDPYQLLDPEGSLHVVNMRKLLEFCQERGLESTNMSDMLRGRMRHSCGWTRADKPEYHVTLRHIDGRIKTICRYHCKPFVETHALHRSCLIAVMAGKRKSHAGWSVKT